MASISDVFQNDAFKQLPMPEQLKVARRFDEFNGLPPKEQGLVLAKVRGYKDPVDVPEKDAGFLSTLGTDLKKAFTSVPSASDSAVIGRAKDLGRASKEQFNKGIGSYKAGDIAAGTGHVVAAALPGVGPAAAQAGDEIEQGQYGQGAAHAAEILAPEAVPTALSLAGAGGRLAKNAFNNNRIVKAVKAAHEGASAATPEVMAKPASPPVGKPATSEPNTPPAAPSGAAAPKKAPVSSRTKPTPGTTPTGEPIPGTAPFKNFKSPANEPAPPKTAPQGRAPRPSDDFYKVHAQVKKAVNSANQLHAQGIKAADLMKLSDDELKQALGKHSRETYNRILFELRGLESGKVKPIK